MVYFVCLYLFGFVLGMVGVASNPAPYFAALGLGLSSGAGCGVLAVSGSGFLALSLFLIYLGGMLVVFGYTTALAADPHPETWGDTSVYGHAVFYIVLVVAAFIHFVPWGWDMGAGMLSNCKEFLMVRGDTGGVSMLYAHGGVMMLLCAWVLLLTLFVVLELTRGQSRGALRSV
uniref:NADH-ubiquinone oxidoreductase chain 6 n=1 Tax=Gilchristella aestuaria TaxID=521029 RepID=H1UCM2_9TELE|nr:NADH dehydrogenase subunit 6 [Gilchristella aestuaria]